jgi:hypothetical protein
MAETELVVDGEEVPEVPEHLDPPVAEVAPVSTHHTLSPLALHLIQALEKDEDRHDERKMTVNALVSKVAFWYEKLRKAMEYREEEVLLRATIERILKRRLLLGGNAKTTAEPLVRELLWARYLPENDVPESLVDEVEHSIDLFLRLRFAVLQKHTLPEKDVNTWISQLMSADIEHLVSPNKVKELVGNFMYQILKRNVEIDNEKEETQSAQVYIAVRKAFARDDLAFLRYHLFRLYFGRLTEESLPDVAHRFSDGYREINKELKYPKKEKIYAYVKKRTAPFLILEDVLLVNQGHEKRVIENVEELKNSIMAACEVRYQAIGTKVRTAIIRSVMFILISKVAIAFLVEGTYERMVYGEIQWVSIIINITVPAFLMIVASFFIRTPGKENSERIVEFINQLLFSDNPRMGHALHLKRGVVKQKPLNIVFTLLWFGAFLLTFGIVVYILSRVGMNPVSQGIFLFFLTIVSFLAYRISLTAHVYRLGDKQHWFTPISDFLFMPIIRVGRGLTQSISQVNFFLFLFDFIIEAPFKLIFGFFEQWFSFLQSKREELE